MCDLGFSEPATPIPHHLSSLSSPLNLLQGLGETHQFLETQVAEALIRMKYPTPTSDGVDLSPEVPSSFWTSPSKSLWLVSIQSCRLPRGY